MPHRIIPGGIVRAMDPRDFFNELLRRRRLNPTSLALAMKAAGKTEVNLQPHLSKWLNREVAEPAVSTMLPVAEFLGVSLGAFYRPKEARAEMDRLNGRTDRPCEVVTRIKSILDPSDQDRFDALPSQQRQDISQITVQLVDAFTRFNEPIKGKATAWPKQQHESDLTTRTLKGATTRKKKGGAS